MTYRDNVQSNKLNTLADAEKLGVQATEVLKVPIPNLLKENLQTTVSDTQHIEAVHSSDKIQASNSAG